MNRRDFLKLSSASLIALNLTGCVTAHMYRARYSDEELSSVLISQDGKHLVAITDKHDYIFDNTPRLSAVIRGDLHPYASASFDAFHASPGGATSGTVVLRLVDLPQNLRQQAAEAGFQPDRLDNLVLRLPLQGTMYKGNSKPLNARYRLNRTYDVRIKQDPSALATAGRILATPITVAADGALILSGVTFLMIAIPFIKSDGF